MAETISKKNRFAECIVEDGIIIIHFNPGIMDLECAIESVNLRLEISKGETYPFLSDTRLISNITKEARDYFASDEGTRQISASGLVFKSKAHKLIGDFFLKINKPKVPVKLFTSFEDAKIWLSQYSKK